MPKAPIDKDSYLSFWEGEIWSARKARIMLLPMAISSLFKHTSQF